MILQILQLILFNEKMKVDFGWIKVHLLTINFNHYLIIFILDYLVDNYSKLIWLTSYLIKPTSTFISSSSNISCKICWIILVISNPTMSSNIFWSCCPSKSSPSLFNCSRRITSIIDFNFCKVSSSILNFCI